MARSFRSGPIDEVFNSWDAYSQQIEYLSFSWLTDLSQQAVDGFQQYYGITSAGFKEFLRTLGLRTYPGSGSDKPAFVELKTDAAARGWIVQ